MADEALLEVHHDHTRPTRRIIASVDRIGDIVRVAAMPSIRPREPRTERVEVPPPARPFVPPPVVVDDGHVRISRRRAAE